MKNLGLILVTVAGTFIAISSGEGIKNVVFIIADDLGYNDVSWHNPDIISPNLDNLARSGIILESAYAQPVCSPTRSAIMTGYYPIHTGRQHNVIGIQEPRGLYTNFTLLPEMLKPLGFRSHAVGKWHLGFCDEPYLPTRRGFDTFHGLWQGGGEHFYHLVPPTVGGGPSGYDYRANEEVDLDASGVYSSEMIGKHAQDAILDHKANHSEDNLFLYVAFQAPHMPLEAPSEYLSLYPNIDDQDRKVFSAMVSALDAAVGGIIDSLVQTGLYNDTLIVFTSDNGGWPQFGGNNYPLRGGKVTLYEGGTRVPTFIHSPMLGNAGSSYHGLMHAIDWAPTIVGAVGGNSDELGTIDGVNQWDRLVNLQESRRSEMLYNIDYLRVSPLQGPGAALRVGDFKLICGNAGSYDGWIEPGERSTGVVSLDNHHLIHDSGSMQSSRTFADDCRAGSRSVVLYDLANDPEERHDIAKSTPQIVELMLQRLAEYEAGAISAHVAMPIKEGNPNYFGGFWSTGWCLAEP